jgi:hypothetical protein
MVRGGGRTRKKKGKSEERFIARKASDGEPFLVAALLRMTAKKHANRGTPAEFVPGDCERAIRGSLLLAIAATGSGRLFWLLHVA